MLGWSIVRGKIDWVSNVAQSNVRRPNFPRANGCGQMSWTRYTGNAYIGLYQVEKSPAGKSSISDRHFSKI